MSFILLKDLYEHFDQLAMAEDTDPDLLFASSYIRGFLALAASDFGDEQQTLSTALAEKVSKSIDEARTELTPQDRVLVQDYWLALRVNFQS